MMKSFNRRMKTGLFMHLVLAGIGLVWIVLSVNIFFTLDIKLVAGLGLMVGLFLIFYSVKKFLEVRRVIHLRQQASEHGVIVSATVVDKKISSLGRQSYWSLSAIGQLAEKEIHFTDKFLFKDIVDRFEVGSTVDVKVVTDNPTTIEFQLEDSV